MKNIQRPKTIEGFVEFKKFNRPKSCPPVFSYKNRIECNSRMNLKGIQLIEKFHSQAIEMNFIDALKMNEKEKERDIENLINNIATAELNQAIPQQEATNESDAAACIQLINGFTQLEIQEKEKLLKRNQLNELYTKQVLMNLKTLSEQEKRKAAEFYKQRRDPALRYQDLSQRLQWGPTFKLKRSDAKAVKKSNAPSASNAASTATSNASNTLNSKRKSCRDIQFASQALGFIVQPKQQKPKWLDPIQCYNKKKMPLFN